MCFRYSAIQILLQIFIMFNFLSVIHSLITVNVLVVSRWQRTVWVSLLIMLNEYNHPKRDWNWCNISKIKQGQLVYYSHKKLTLTAKLNKNEKKTLNVQFFSQGKSICCGVLIAYFGTGTFIIKNNKQIRKVLF